jgi:hypothetical protein
MVLVVEVANGERVIVFQGPVGVGLACSRIPHPASRLLPCVTDDGQAEQSNKLFGDYAILA